MESAELKSKSKNSFRDFISGRWGQVGAILIIGILLLLLSGGMGDGNAAEDLPAAEDRVAEICSLMDGVGECRVLMTYDPDRPERVYAVLVLCEGADSVSVRRDITALFCSLYGIGANRVEIGKLNK